MPDNGEHKVFYPVAFVPGGDTTRDAFSKHIQEIERIYGQLAELDSHKLESTTLTDTMKEHIEDANPHPNYKPPVPSMGDVTGSLAASRVSGDLTNATIGYGKVTGLKDYIKSLLPEDEDTGDGIIGEELSENGYVKFNNGLIVQWGISGPGFVEFPIEFPNLCFMVVGTLANVNGPVGSDSMRVKEWTTTGFTCNTYTEWAGYGAGFCYLAIGK